MGADIKSLRIRMRSVESTLQLTKAMELVASSKIRKATENMQKSRSYAASCEEVVSMLASVRDCRRSPYMKNGGNGKTKIVVIAGDRGLAGGYNANVFRLVREFEDAEILPIGKRAHDRYGFGYTSCEKFTSGDAEELAKILCKEFADGKYSKIGVLYTKYKSVMSQIPCIKWLFPIPANENNAGGAVFEPGETEVLESAVPVYVAGIIMWAVRESFACEVAARRIAMDSAGKSAKEMTENLKLRYNRARQGAITQEITEIVAGSD